MYNNDTDILIGNNILRFGTNIPKSKSGLYSLFDLSGIGSPVLGLNEIGYGDSITGDIISSPSFVRLPNGNVGINTASPSSKLEILGQSSIGSNYTFKASNNSSYKSLYVADNGSISMGQESPINPATLTLGSNSGTYNFVNFGSNGEAANFFTSTGQGMRAVFKNNGAIDINLASDNGVLTYFNNYVSAAFRYNVEIGQDPGNPYNFNNNTRLNVKGFSSTSGDYASQFFNSSNVSLFQIRNDGVILAPSIPTSSAGLPSRALYEDAGFIKITP